MCASVAWGEGIGAYFTLVNTYIYSKGPRTGSRYLVRPRLAFTVVDVTVDSQDTIWYKIIYPPRTTKVSGLGWTPTAPHEILAPQPEPVLVFSRIPSNGNDAFTVLSVPVSGVELLNESQSDPRFAQVRWQKVRYELSRPLRAWARGTAGIYRAGKTETFLSRVYGEMVTRVVGKEKITRFLSGVIRIGDSLREAGWALGQPLNEREETVANTKRTTWHFQEMVVVFENQVVKQIN